MKLHGSAVEPGRKEYFFDQPAHLLGFFGYNLTGLLVIGDNTSFYSFGITADRCERSLKLVRSIFKELLLGQAASFEPSADHIAFDASDHSYYESSDQKENTHLFDRNKLCRNINIGDDGDSFIKLVERKYFRTDEVQHIISDKRGDKTGNSIVFKCP